MPMDLVGMLLLKKITEPSLIIELKVVQLRHLAQTRPALLLDIPPIHGLAQHGASWDQNAQVCHQDALDLARNFCTARRGESFDLAKVLLLAVVVHPLALALRWVNPVGAHNCLETGPINGALVLVLIL